MIVISTDTVVDYRNTARLSVTNIWYCDKVTFSRVGLTNLGAVCLAQMSLCLTGRANNTNCFKLFTFTVQVRSSLVTCVVAF